MSPKIFAFNLGSGPVTLGEAYKLPANHPNATSVVETPTYSFCIIFKDRVVMIDAGALPTGIHAEEYPMTEPTPPPLLQQMAEQQISADRVSEVIITHTHWDHYNGLCQETNGKFTPAFPNARHIIHTADWNPERFKKLENETLKVVDDHGLVTLIDGQMELADGITIIPMPGETPGHQIVELFIDDQTHYFCGDLFHDPIEFDDFSINVPWAEPVSMVASKRATLSKAAENRGLLYFSHIDGVFQVHQQGDTFKFEKRAL